MSGTELALAVIAICVFLMLYFRNRRRTYRPLSSYRPEMPQEEPQRELGLEAIDMDAIDDVNRRNDALSSMTGAHHSQSRHTKNHAERWKPRSQDNK